MTQSAYPFSNSPILDANQWSKMAQNWLGTGVIKGILNELQVYADSTGMQIKVKSGQAYVKGHFFESSAEEVLAIGTASSNPRIDRVIVRVDWIANTLQLAVLQGVAAVSPTAPALTQNSSRWEISLAQIAIGTNASTIATGNVTDERTFVKVANAAQPKWIDLPLINGWTWYGSGGFPQYFVDDRNFLHTKGLVKDGVSSGGVGIARLPVGARPAVDRKLFSWDGVNSAKRIDIQSDGYIIIPIGGSVNNTYLTLDFPPIRLD